MSTASEEHYMSFCRKDQFSFLWPILDAKSDLKEIFNLQSCLTPLYANLFKITAKLMNFHNVSRLTPSAQLFSNQVTTPNWPVDCARELFETLKTRQEL